MVYSYLLDIYGFLDREAEEIRNLLESTDSDQERLHLEGRLEVIEETRNFLRSGYHHRLPRRLQKLY